MAFKVVDVITTSKETSSEIDLLSDIDASRSVKEKIKQDVGEFLVESVLESISTLNSPISGGSYKKTLSPEYKKLKVKEGGAPRPDLELSSLMLNELSFKKTDDGIKLGVFGEAALRADGHSNLSGESSLPERQFLPRAGDEFKSNIQKGIDQIIADNLLEEADLSKSDLRSVSSKDELYDKLKSEMPDMTNAEIKNAVLRNEDLVDLLDELDLLDLL